MRTTLACTFLSLCLLLLGPAAAQLVTNNATTAATCSCPDVLLNVTNLGVDNITLTVSQEAHLNLNAKIGSFVQLTAGVDASIDQVQLTILGIHAQADLTVRLDNVYKIVSRALDTVDRNPQILTRTATDSAQNLIQAVTNLLATTVDAVGNIVQTVITQAGEILQRTLNQAGTLLSTVQIGNIADFPQVGNFTNTAGQLVKIFSDPATGNLIEATYDALGNITATKVLMA